MVDAKGRFAKFVSEGKRWSGDEISRQTLNENKRVVELVGGILAEFSQPEGGGQPQDLGQGMCGAKPSIENAPDNDSPSSPTGGSCYGCAWSTYNYGDCWDQTRSQACYCARNWANVCCSNDWCIGCCSLNPCDAWCVLGDYFCSATVIGHPCVFYC